MKREVTRKKNLPAFHLDMAELELLWNKVIQLFDAPEQVYVSLSFEMKGEKFDFNNIDELRTYQGLPVTLKRFSLWFSQGGNHISIGTVLTFGDTPEVRASGKTEAWCAGAVETVSTFMSQHRIWYYWFLVAPVGWLLTLVLYSAFPLAILIPKDYKIPIGAVVAWCALIFTLLLLYASRARLLPLCVLELRPEQNFWRKYSTELTIFLAATSAVISLITLLIPFFVTK
jgi:hypothetical protein